MAPDEILKNAMASFAFESLVIAACKSLIALAEHSGNEAAIAHFEENLDEEVAMTEWPD